MQDGPEKGEFLRLAVMVVGLPVPSDTTKGYWVLQRRLLPHAERCAGWIGEIFKAEWALGDVMTINSVHMLGILYADQGRLKEAEAMHKRALRG